jgi:hypothetical protein
VRRCGTACIYAQVVRSCVGGMGRGSGQRMAAACSVAVSQPHRWTRTHRGIPSWSQTQIRRQATRSSSSSSWPGAAPLAAGGPDAGCGALDLLIMIALFAHEVCICRLLQGQDPGAGAQCPAGCHGLRLVRDAHHRGCRKPGEQKGRIWAWRRHLQLPAC